MGTNSHKRGNEILFTPQGNRDTFDLYHGPMGGDVRMSIRGASVNNRDELGGQQVQKVGRGPKGPKYRTNRGSSQY